MMTGQITPEYHAMLRVFVLGGQEGRVELDALVDTGFNGYLTLPGDVIRQLGLVSAGHRRAQLADGHAVVLEIFLARLLWHARPREILVLQADGGALVGMALLAGSHVTLEVKAGGTLTIQEFTTNGTGSTP